TAELNASLLPVDLAVVQETLRVIVSESMRGPTITGRYRQFCFLGYGHIARTKPRATAPFHRLRDGHRVCIDELSIRTGESQDGNLCGFVEDGSGIRDRKMVDREVACEIRLSAAAA